MGCSGAGRSEALWADGPNIMAGEAFFPDGSPYLGQAVLGEPIGQSNVLPPNRRLS